jgi:tetratricopeptide (TPR) repeat protein
MNQPDWTHTAEIVAAQIASLPADAAPLLVATLHGALGATLADGAQGCWTEDLVSCVLAAYAKALECYALANENRLRVLTLRNVGDTHFAAAARGIGNARLHAEAAIALYEQAVSRPAVSAEVRDAWRQELANLYEFVIERWEALLPIISRDVNPYEWADARISLGGLYRVREAFERAVALLDEALEVLTADDAPELWCTAHYHRGLAYVSRKDGDQQENLAKGLESLRLALQYTSPEHEPRMWAVLATAIGHSELARGQFAEARASFESALTVDESVLTPGGWTSTQLLVAALRLGMTPSAETVVDNVWIHDDVNDPFDMLGELGEISQSMQAGELIDIDEQWRVPFFVYEDVARLRRHLTKSIRTIRVWPRDAEARTSLERGRLEAYFRLFEQFSETLLSERRTFELFADVAQGNQTFALLLREFNTRVLYYRRGSVRVGDLGEMFRIYQLAGQIAPLPLVWIGNPADAQPRGRPDEGFRVDAGATWKADVRALVQAASFIVMDNSAMSPGVRTEMDILRELGRIDATPFTHPAAARDYLGVPC